MVNQIKKGSKTNESRWTYPKTVFWIHQWILPNTELVSSRAVCGSPAYVGSSSRVGLSLTPKKKSMLANSNAYG